MGSSVLVRLSLVDFVQIGGGVNDEGGVSSGRSVGFVVTAVVGDVGLAMIGGFVCVRPGLGLVRVFWVDRRDTLGGVGDDIGPTTTLAGAVFGAGDGMYGCLNPAESETTGIFLGGREGVNIPLDSPVNWGLSSQFVAAVVGGLGGDGFSTILSVIT